MGQLGQLLSNLVSGFLLLRDFFGYLLPGSVFVAGPYYIMKLDNKTLIMGFPNWIIVIVGSYLCGNILAAFGYSTIRILNGVFNIILWHTILGKKIKNIMQKLAIFARTSNINQNNNNSISPKIDTIELYNPEFIYYRYRYPHLYYEVDRQDTLNIFRITLATSLILSPWWTPAMVRIFVFVIGVLLFINGYIWFNRMSRIRQQTIDAAKMMEKEDRRLARLSGLRMINTATSAREKDSTELIT